jgi:methylmalonyl-CoA epimerase
MRVEQLDHIHIVVRDLQKAVDFFESLLGIKFAGVIQVEGWDAISRIAAIGSVGIELIQPTSPQSIFAKFLEQRGEGVQALSLKVPDIEEAKAEMQARGMKLVSDYSMGCIKEAHFHPKDAFGVLIELCQYQAVHGASLACFEQEHSV